MDEIVFITSTKSYGCKQYNLQGQWSKASQMKLSMRNN